jgi:type IV pilus assembly protein PilY1
VNEIIEQTTASFTSAVVPTSQTRFGSGFYNAFFESSQAPVWAGHLEAYHLAPDGEVQDANLDPVLDANGDLLPTRVPFWDAGDELAGNASRTLYTTKAGARIDFDATLLTDADLAIAVAELPVYPNHPASGVDTLAELRSAVVSYVRGSDAFDEDGDSDATELRPVVLGDIFHSTPQVVGPPSPLLLHESGYRDYRNLYATRDRVVYAGANDGVFHAFDAGSYYTGDDGSTPETENGYTTAGSGAERFGYVPGALLPRVKLVPRNSPRAYSFADGSPVAADVWLGDGSGSDTSKSAAEWATVLVTGYREGGSGYLALDVTDPDAGASDPHGPYPVLLWEFTHAKLGDSWSEPVITRVKLRGPVGVGDHCGPDDGDGDCLERWVAIFGGGYRADGDPNRSDYVGDPANAAWSAAGKAIFMVALDTGELLASVEHDASGVAGPDDMLYALPATPSVLDLDFDGFADVVYIGDLGGQLWKWDVHGVGSDTTGDSRIDDWAAGVFFRTDPVSVAGSNHHRSFFFPPSASYLSGKLVLAFGSGERHDLIYLGDAGADENNRFYVVRDDYPTGASAFPELGEGDLTDVTGSDVDGDATDHGFYFRVADGEKFVTEFTIFAGYAIAASFTPVPSADLCATAGGQGFLYAVRLASGAGYFADPSAPPSEDRRIAIGGGLPSRPRITLGEGTDEDVIWIKTSKGKILTFEPPPRDVPNASMIYWRQRF